jgi:hypothetical protein
VSRLLTNQTLPLARITTDIFLLAAGHPHDAHHPRLAAAIRSQSPQQHLPVNAVALRSAATLFHRNAGRIKHVVRNPSRDQQPMQPEAIKPRFTTASFRPSLRSARSRIRFNSSSKPT